MLATALAMAMTASDPLQINYRSRAGLFLTLDGIPVVQGSFFQFYEAGWSRGYYSSNWNDQEVRRVPGGVDVTFRSPDRRVSGAIQFRRTPDGVRGEYEFTWSGEREVRLEASLGHLWSPALERGSLRIDGVPVSRSLTERFPSAQQDPRGRQLGPEGRAFDFRSPFGTVAATIAGPPSYVFDARGYTGDFARERDLFWLGMTDVVVRPNEPLRFAVDWRFAVPPRKALGALSARAETRPLEGALGAYEGRLPMVPLPKRVEPGQGAPFVWPAQISDGGVRRILNERYSGVRSGRGGLNLARVTDLRPGGYRLRANARELRVEYGDAEGRRNGLMRAANLTEVIDGQLAIRPISIEDWPSIGYRGIHMFVGPTAVEWQGRLMWRVLAPLMINQVTLQCERTDWLSQPKIRTHEFISRQDLARLFAAYRAVGIEPTPLIQSFGHMGWLFANGQNRDTAFNPEVLFSVDPRKPRTREVLGALWDEAVALLKPKKIHFGLDEVDMRGWPENPKLVTDLWRLHVPFLAGIAERHRVGMVVWGDKMLAPGEAPDATHGHTAADAAARRAILPRGAYVADWHYINRDDPAIYRSLALFQREGLRPIAATWNRPENIKGFFKAAELAGVGVLQTTWAGYESREDNMLRESSQYLAYLLAAEYAWSGRPERAANLPYRPEDLLRRLMYTPALPLRPQAGHSVPLGGAGTPVTLGPVRFMEHAPLGFYSPLLEGGDLLPESRSFEFSARARGIAILASVQARLGEIDPVATVEVEFAGGERLTRQIRYGEHVRANADARLPLAAALKDGRSAVVLALGARAEVVRRVTITSRSPASGFAIHGVTLY